MISFVYNVHIATAGNEAWINQGTYIIIRINVATDETLMYVIHFKFSTLRFQLIVSLMQNQLKFKHLEEKMIEA